MMHVCVGVCVYVWVGTCMYRRIYVCVCMYVHTPHTHTQTHNAYIRMWIHMHTRYTFTQGDTRKDDTEARLSCHSTLCPNPSLSLLLLLRKAGL